MWCRTCGSFSGLKVALIQDRPLFGGNASQEIRVHTLGIHGYGSDILESIDTVHYPNGDQKAKIDQVKRGKTMSESGVDLFAHHTACGIEKQGDKILSVEAREVKDGKIKRFRAPVFIDATEMAGWAIGPEQITGTVVKQLPSIMKDGISTVNFGVRRKRIIALWEPVYCGIVSVPLKDRTFPRFHGLCQLPVSMQLPKENGLGIFR